jgi:hypothetical protein
MQPGLQGDSFAAKLGQKYPLKEKSMIYEKPKTLWTVRSIPVVRVLPGVGGMGADRSAGGAVHQPASRKLQSEGAIPPQERFNDAGLDRPARQE